MIGAATPTAEHLPWIDERVCAPNTGGGIGCDETEEEAMVSITEIQEAIRVLPETEYAQLREWISDLDWERWDSQIEADSEAGRLDFLIAEAREGEERGALEEL